MTDIQDVIDAIVTDIKAGMAGDIIAGRTFGFAPDSLNPPTAVVVPGPGEFLVYDDTFDGTDNFAAVVKVLLGTQDSESAQKMATAYMAKSSIRASILTGTTLRAICSFVEIPHAQNYNDVEWAGQQFLGFELPVAVFL